MCISPGSSDVVLFWGEMPFFELKNVAKIKDTTETVCQRNSSDTAQQIFKKLCSCEGHTM